MAQIEVSIKIRPLIGRETSRLWTIPDENQLIQIDPRTNTHRGETYCFDHVFSEACRNTEVFDVVAKSIVEATVNGFNGTVFAYGQTSSGKTHTMRGSADDPGIMQLAVEYLFQLMGQKLDREFLLRISYIEIYNETINDLLNRDNVNLKVKEENGQVIIPSATEETAVSIPSIFALLEKGEQNRRIAETCMNDRSSRSHAIFRLLIESKGIDDAVQVSQLNLVDLAGSEKTGQSGLTGSTFKEGCHINKSLTVLGKVIKDLSENPEGFINYRDSKLTRILQSALGGNALTAIVCTVAPGSADHTTSTLGFAQRAKKIKNKPKKNEVLSKDAHIKRLHLQMAELLAELETFKGHRTKENEVFNSEKLDNLKKLQDMLINGTIASNQNDSEMKQKAKRRQTWCDTKSFKQARKSAGSLGPTQLWALQSIQEQDSIGSGSTEDNVDWLSPSNSDNFQDEFLTSPVNFATPHCASDFVTTRRGTGSCLLSVHVETPPTLLREKANTYFQDLKSLQELTVHEKQINQETLLEKLKQAEADNAKLKLELSQLETSRFEVEYEQAKKLEKSQQRVIELQSSLESAWSSQSGIENQSRLLETENKALLCKMELMDQVEQNSFGKAITTTHGDHCKVDARPDMLDRHKQSLLNEIVALNPKFEMADAANADVEELLKLLLSTVTEKEYSFFTNLTETYDSKEKICSNEVNSLKQKIAELEKLLVNLPECGEMGDSELSDNFKSQLAVYDKQLEEKQITISELELKLIDAQKHVLQNSKQIESPSSKELLKDKDNQILEMQAKLQEKMVSISELESKLSKADAYGCSRCFSPEITLKVKDCLENSETNQEEKSSFAQLSPTFHEVREKFTELHSQVGPLHISFTPNVSVSVEHESVSASTLRLSYEKIISELQAKVERAEAQVETCAIETQTEIITVEQSISTEVCDPSHDDKNIIQELEIQLEKTCHELICKQDEIQSMQASLTDKCLINESLRDKFTKIDTEFKSLVENHEAVANKLRDTESELNAKNQSIAFLETKLQENCVATDDLIDNLSSSNKNLITNSEARTFLEDQLITVRASLKANLEDNEKLQKTLFEKALMVEVLESKCIEQEARYQEQSARFQLLEDQLHRVETDLKASLNEVFSLQNDLKDKSKLVDELQSRASEKQTIIDALETKQKYFDVELNKSLEIIRNFGEDRKKHTTEIHSMQEKLEKLESMEMNMKMAEEIDQAATQHQRETKDSIESVLNEKLDIIEEITNRMEKQQMSIEENKAVVQCIKEQNDRFEKELAVKLNEIKTMNTLIAEQSKCLSENALTIRLLEEKTSLEGLSHEKIISELQAKVERAGAQVETCAIETQTEIITVEQSISTEVCDPSHDDKNIIQELEIQLEKTCHELICKQDEIQSMQASLTDKCLINESLRDKFTKIDTEFKSLVENHEAVANKLRDTESELNAKNQSIAFLETKLQENCVATDDLIDNLSSSNKNLITNSEARTFLEDQLITVRASLKANLEDNEKLQKTLFEKALMVEVLESKCIEQEARYQEQSARFQLLEDQLHRVETDLKASLNEVFSLQNDLKDKSKLVDELQSRASEKQTIIDALETKQKYFDVELNKSLEIIRNFGEDCKKHTTEIHSMQEKLEKLESMEMNMKMAQETDQAATQHQREMKDSIESVLNEKLDIIEEITNRMEKQQMSIEENKAVVQCIKEQNDRFEKELAIKLNEIKTMNTLIAEQSKCLSENALTIRLLEEKSNCYEKDLKNNLEKINEATCQLELQGKLLEDRANAILTLTEQLEEAKQDAKDMDKENDYLEALFREAEARERVLETDMETLHAELEEKSNCYEKDLKNKLEKINEATGKLELQGKLLEDRANAILTLTEQLEEAKQDAKDMDKENAYKEALFREAEARASLAAARADTDNLKAEITKYQTLEKNLSDGEKQLAALQQENKFLKEIIETTKCEKRELLKELQSLKRSPCECKNLKAQVKTLLKDVERTNLELVQRNGEYAQLEIQIIKEEFPQKAIADKLRKENEEMKIKIKTLKAELHRIQAQMPDETMSFCPSCLAKPRTAAKFVQTELPLKIVTADAAKLPENRSEEMQRLLGKNQLYKRIAHDRMRYIIELEKEKESLVPGFVSRYVVGENKENK